MASAYAALISLVNTMDHVQNHPRLSGSFDKEQIETLGEIVGFLLDFVEIKHSNGKGGVKTSKRAEMLEIRIASAAYAAEDLIESHVVDQIHSNSISLLDLKAVTEDIDSIKEEANKVIEEEMAFQLDLPQQQQEQEQSTHIIWPAVVVGVDDQFSELMDILTGEGASRQIIPIVGMGGTGKTTLARNVYHSPLIQAHFEIRAWVTISQRFDVKDILLRLLCDLEEYHYSYRGENLGGQITHTLWGKRYLIILDDMWSIEAWNEIKFCFPNNNNRSRIIVTTRQSDVAMHFGPSHLAMKFLDDDKAWRLLCKTTFGEEACPFELEELGREIANKCKGLPLSIFFIGGYLRTSSRTRETWENTANNIKSILKFLTKDLESLHESALLSYNHLPVHLKVCFLYMGIFPEDYEIRVSELVRLWIAEGFLKPNKFKSPEEVAEGYIRDLADTDLIFVRSLRSNGKIKTCGIHDLSRDVWLRISREVNLFRVMNEDVRQNIDGKRRIVFHERIQVEESQCRGLGALQSAPLARTLICSGVKLPFRCRLLRVLKFRYITTCSSDVFREAIFQQVNLRYLNCSVSRLPQSISLLWNLQTLILRGNDPLPDVLSEIWSMPMLRHLKLPRFSLPDPSTKDQQNGFVLQNLHTLKTVINFKCTTDMCKWIPNIKKLRIEYDDFSSGCSCYCLYNLGLLHKLESLHCSFYGLPSRDDLLQNLVFPSLLLKLTLAHCGLHWEDLAMIGSLPYLEVLNLLWFSFGKSKWKPVTGEFERLKFLKISNSNLMWWNAKHTHFPVLEKLVLQGLDHLDCIPSGIGEISTLGVIEVDRCSEDAVSSAIGILKRQKSIGKEGLQLRIQFRSKAEQERFREMEEIRGRLFKSDNLQFHADETYDSDGNLTFDGYSSDE